jgi:hypothetical protein
VLAISATNDPSPHIRQRSKRMRVKTLAFDSYLVTPPEKGKAKRLVQFDMSEQGVVKVECVKQDDTGEVCEANVFSKHCSHVEAAIRRLSENIKKEQVRQEAAKTELKRSKKLSREIKKHPTQKRLDI